MLFYAIFEFLKLFKDVIDDNALPKDSTLVEQKREFTFHLGLVYYFAKLFHFLESRSYETTSPETAKKCVKAVAEMIPPNRLGLVDLAQTVH